MATHRVHPHMSILFEEDAYIILTHKYSSKSWRQVHALLNDYLRIHHWA
ncbi:Ankyrin repeat protein [Venturia inaequalis]|nr:Ankyrin repeat protein [Venturia inaequalis]